MIHYIIAPENYAEYLLDPDTAPQGLGRNNGYTYEKYKSFIYDINLLGESVVTPSFFVHMSLHKGFEHCVYFIDAHGEAKSYITEDIWNLYYNVFNETRKIIVRAGYIEIEKEKSEGELFDEMLRDLGYKTTKN